MKRASDMAMGSLPGTSAGEKKKKSRWGAETEKLEGLPKDLNAEKLTAEQEKMITLQVQIEHISRRLRLPDVGISQETNRSPSPEPTYDNSGKRTNTREVRTRQKLEYERHKLIKELLKLNPGYKPPADYKPMIERISERVPIPQDEFPETNFVGLLIGPRGNSLRQLEKDTNCKITIRGKGSIREGKAPKGPFPGEDEPLHVYVQGASLESVRDGVKRVEEIIRSAIEVPEGENEFRKKQLVELAMLNGTYKEFTHTAITRLKEVAAQRAEVLTNQIKCELCGGYGHITSDCKFRNDPESEVLALEHKHASADAEYDALMAELSGKPMKNAPIQKVIDASSNNGSESPSSKPSANASPNHTTDANSYQNYSYGYGYRQGAMRFAGPPSRAPFPVTQPSDSQQQQSAAPVPAPAPAPAPPASSYYTGQSAPPPPVAYPPPYGYMPYGYPPTAAGYMPMPSYPPAPYPAYPYAPPASSGYVPPPPPVPPPVSTAPPPPPPPK